MHPAVFRQTAAERDHYARSGVTIVESEIASLFAVCSAHGVAAGAVVVVGSNPDIDIPAPRWDSISETQRQVLTATVSALA